MNNIYLVTGSAGFIRSALVLRLLERGDIVVGIDNHNDYYVPALKEARLAQQVNHSNYTHLRIDLTDRKAIEGAFAKFKPQRVINLAAQAGVRYSIENPHAYIDANIRGFLNILELSKKLEVNHLIYASSSSVYGLNREIPFSEEHNVDHPLSLYAATKKSNELMAHTYSYLFNIPTTGLRFFTVYGPWGRPDMALFKFTKALVDNECIYVNNFGDHARDFTYVDDIVNGILSVIKCPFPDSASLKKIIPSPAESNAPWRILNIGRGEQVPLMDFIDCIEAYFGKKIQKEFLPLQAGDVPNTFCNTNRLQHHYNYSPNTSIKEGVYKFLDWYVDFYKVSL